MIGGIAIAVTIYIGFLGALNKYGPQFLSGWTIENTLIFAGLFALFVLATYIPWRIYNKKFGLPYDNESLIKYAIFKYALIIGILAAITAVGILISFF